MVRFLVSKTKRKFKEVAQISLVRAHFKVQLRRDKGRAEKLKTAHQRAIAYESSSELNLVLLCCSQQLYSQLSSAVPLLNLVPVLVRVPVPR